MRAIDNYDIIIVGGGPAGVMAALHSKGDVLLVEKKKKIGVPVHCGEGLYGKIIDKFDLKDCVKDAYILHDVMFHFPNGYEKKITIKSNDIYIINKDLFLQRILEKAKKNNDSKITVKTNTTASYKDGFVVLNNKTRAYGRVIIDASGISSVIGRKIGMTFPLKKEDIHVCMQYTVKGRGDLDPDMIHLFLDKPYAPGGYLWVFPKGGDIANIGMGIPSNSPYDLRGNLDKFIKEKYYGCEIIRKFTAPVCLAPPANICVKDNIILTGDSARYTIPVSGAGIGNAMLSGYYAGKIATANNNGNMALGVYQYYMEELLYSKLWKAYRYKQKMLDQGKLEKLSKYAKPLFALHSLFPKTTERFTLKNFRF